MFTLFDVNNPTFRFVSKERFFGTRYDEDVSQTLKNSMTDVSHDVTDVMRKLLPRLTDVFRNLNGKMFGFGD